MKKVPFVSSELHSMHDRNTLKSFSFAASHGFMTQISESNLGFAFCSDLAATTIIVMCSPDPRPAELQIVKNSIC